MNTAFSFEDESFEFDLEFEPEEETGFPFATVDSEIADSEWREELRGGSRFPTRGVMGSQKPSRLRQPAARSGSWSSRRPSGSARSLFASRGIIYEPATYPVEDISFARWVQISLNQVLGLRLPVTGTMNSATRNGVRLFQERHGLAADGIANSETERALVAAKRARRSQNIRLTGSAEDREFDSLEFETAAALPGKLKSFSLLPHLVEVNGKDVVLTPGLMDPGIYDGPVKYKVSLNDGLQKCLMEVMKRPAFSQIRVTLVDLTTGVPQLAAYNHKDQVFVASVAKIAAMLGAFQLRHDLRGGLKQKKPTPKTLEELFALLRDDLVAAQLDPRGQATPLTTGLSLRGKLVLLNGSPVALRGPNAPKLTDIFKAVPVGSPVTIEFKSTGESFDQLATVVAAYNKARHAKDWAETKLAEAKQQGDANRVAEATRVNNFLQDKLAAEEGKINALGFKERMGIMVGGDVPASNFATFTVVRDVGHLYIASTLVQSGLYDTNRKGGLWLGADYAQGAWRGPLGGGTVQSATAGSLAAFMTLLIKKRLVSPIASHEMRLLMQKLPDLTNPGTGSWFWNGLYGLRNSGSLKTVLAKVGLAGGADDLAYIEREVDIGGGKKKLLCYAAAGLRARGGGDLQQLIVELDKCILANNGLTPAQGGHGP